jgi:hypothetical protein
MFLGERRISPFWMAHGQTRMSTSFRSLPGPEWESRRSSTIGSEGWLLTIIVLRSSFLAGLFTDRAPVETLRPPMNFLMLLLAGLVIRIQGCREEVSNRLAQDVRQGAHAQKVMAAYQSWFGEGPELSVLRLLGLFDRPADEKALGVLLKPPAIPGLTESLTDLRPTAWRTILAKLRRARLLAGEDLHNPGHLDTHPLVREYFGEQLQSQRTEAWKECNRRLYNYYRTLAPQLPDSVREMEPLFLTVICGCNAGLLWEALHEVYIPRIQRGNAYFAANVLGARGALLSVLVHFFEHGRWGSLWESHCTSWVISTPRDETRCLVLRSGVRKACSLRSKRSWRPPLFVCVMRRYSIGI